MADESVIVPIAPPAPVTPASPVQPPATEPTPPAPAEHMIPKSRLDEVLEKSKATERELAQLRKEKIDREQAGMSDLEKAKLEASANQTKAGEYEKELAALKAERAFEKSVQKLGLTFQSDTAREDAFKFIDASDPANIEKELKRVTTERPYLLKTTTTPNLDATATGKQTAPDDKYLEEVRKRYNIRA